MVSRHVEAALTLGIEADDEAVARSVATTRDPVIRSLTRRSVRERLLTTMAELATTRGVDSAPGHVMRVAVLQLRKQPVTDAADPDLVAAAFAALPKRPPPSRMPWLFALVVMVALAGVGLVAYSVLTMAAAVPPSTTYVRPALPESKDAYRLGGGPLRDEALEGLLRDGFATAVVAVDRYTRALDRGERVDPAELAKTLQALATRTEITSRSPGLAKAWAALMSQLVAWSNLSPALEVFGTASHELVMRTHDVSFELAALGLGYYLDADVSWSDRSRDAYLYAYRVERVSILERGPEPRSGEEGKTGVRAEPEPMRVLNLRRLDRLNYHQARFGMQGEELGDPLVLLDQIDDNVVTRDLLVLDPKGSFRIGGDNWADGNQAALALRAAVDGAVRPELVAALRADAEAGTAVGALLHERAGLVLDWKLRPIKTVFLPDGIFDQVTVPKLERRRGERIEVRLAELGAARIAAHLGDALRVSVERHEAQHGYDDETKLRQPPDIEQLVGPVEQDGKPRAFAVRVRDEVSGYLSQIASDPLTPHWALWSLADFAFDRDQWGGVYSHVSAIVLVELARELGAPDVGHVIDRGKIHRARLAELAAVIAAVDGNRLRQAAASTWTRLYGVPYRPILDRT